MRLWDAPAALRLWHVASLDAPTVAVVWSSAFAWAGGVPLPVWAPLVLALIAWAVYIVDRLLDARAGMQSPPRHLLRERHIFHWQHRWLMGTAALVAAATASGLVFTRLPADARAPETAVAAATLAYLSRVHSRRQMEHIFQRVVSPFSSRAFWIGVLFTAGCILPVASQVPSSATTPVFGVLAIPGLFFAALAWLNCLAISRWESDGPSAAQTPIIVPTAGLLAGLGTLLALGVGSWAGRAGGLIAAGTASALLFVLLERLRPRLSPVALRAAADLVLLTPISLLVFVQ